MNRWRFALTRRWFTYLGMAVVFAVACVLLSRWQIGRNDETIAANRLVTKNYSALARPISVLLPDIRHFSAQDRWRQVDLTGTYLTDKQLLVRGRSLGSNPGFEVLTPLLLSDGRVFVVDRGWLPIGTKQDTPDVVPAPPSGTVHVTARLQSSEAELPGRSAPAGQIAEINVPTVAKQVGHASYTAAYGLLATESPAPATRPIAAVKPTIDSGPFLSYAFQWLLFAVFGFGGLAWALRQEYRIRNAEDPEERVRAARRQRRARAKGPTDSEIEDAIVARDLAELVSER